MNHSSNRLLRSIGVLSVGCSTVLVGCGGGGSAEPASVSLVPSAAILESLPQSPAPANNPSVVVAKAESTIDPAVVADRATFARSQQRIGANLTNVRSYSRTHEFADLVMAADGFGNPNAFGSSDAVLGPDGWPVDDFSITLLTGQKPTKGLGGTYLIVYSGNATVDNATCASPGKLQNKRVDPETGKTLVDLVFPEGGSQLCLIFRHVKGANGKPLAPVKDLQVMRPAHYEQWRKPPMFTQVFLDHVARYSTIRVMDWLDTNALPTSPYTGPEGVWSKRPTAVSKRTASGVNVPRGLPWERVTELANVRGVDIWINVPPKADDAYATELAKFLKDNLKYNQNIYVEYGNEMWNGMFLQTHNLWAQGMVEVANATEVGKRINFDGMTEKLDSRGNKRPLTAFQYDLGARLYADRLVRISNAFREVFGDDQMMTRVRPVLAWQLTNPGSTQQLLDYVQGAFKQPPSKYFYAFAGAPYYALTADGINASKAAYAGTLGSSWDTAVAKEPTLELDVADPKQLSLNAILASLKLAVDNSAMWGWYEANSVMARKYQLRWFAYEGGPDTMGIESAKNKAQANREQAMFDLCQGELNAWSKGGGDLFMWFTAGAGQWDSSFGAWPLVENMTDAPGPKMKCMDWASANPAPTAVSRHPMPGVVLASRVVINNGTSANQFTDVNNAKTWYAIGQSQDYAVSSASAQCYEMSLNLSNTSFSKTYTTVPFEVWLNGVQKLSPVAASIPPNSPVTNVPMGNICLPAGISAVTLKLTAATSITLTSFEMK